MQDDIRDRANLTHDMVLSLNFIGNSGRYIYRRHYRFGLRSHIMEVLRREDVYTEQTGVLIDKIRWFPKAMPIKMLRIFRARFNSLEDALSELKRVKMTLAFLTPDHVALSDEFLVSYKKVGGPEILLCGLQEYVEGEILDPWSLLDRTHLLSIWQEVAPGAALKSESGVRWLSQIKIQAGRFVEKTKNMILQQGHVPDLAGFGNLLVTPAGDIKLVDINNISKVNFDGVIRVDDRGYPVCDKSIEALALLEEKLTGRVVDRNEPVYRVFLDPIRMQAVRNIEEKCKPIHNPVSVDPYMADP